MVMHALSWLWSCVHGRSQRRAASSPLVERHHVDSYRTCVGVGTCWCTTDLIGKLGLVKITTLSDASRIYHVLRKPHGKNYNGEPYSYERAELEEKVF